MENILIMYILVSIFGGFVYAELLGYILHVILHSNKIKYLSQSHMIHHLKLYGPKMPQRSVQYKVSVKNRLKISGVGMEWFIPLGFAFVVTVIAGLFINVPILYLSIFVGMTLFWGIFLFAYMHNTMHIKGFWMLHNKVFRKWFLKIRHCHDIHHLKLSNDGKMHRNYGICFFFFDKIFGTFQPKLTDFNEKGYEAAKKRYDYIFKMDV